MFLKNKDADMAVTFNNFWDVGIKRMEYLRYAQWLPNTVTATPYFVCSEVISHLLFHAGCL